MDDQEHLGAYRVEDGRVLIELRLHLLQQLFNSLDPSPFVEKDLDDDAEAYMTGAAREIPAHMALKIVLHLPDSEIGRIRGDEIGVAVRNYFAYRREVAGRDLRQYLRLGRTSLGIGLLFLISCFALRELLQSMADGTLYRVLSEGLLIMGWVAMWRPLQIFLYDWWPIRRTRDIYAKLASAPVEIRPAL